MCGGCNSAGCSWDAAGPCSNNGTCGDCSTQTACNNCSCAGCSWGDTSCPWVAAWDGEKWVREHEAFPFAIFPAVKTTSYDSLPSLKCVNGKAKIQIYEGLPEITFLENFTAYKVKETGGFLKPDLNGRPRVVNEFVSPKKCQGTSVVSSESCLEAVKNEDEMFFEPNFDQGRKDDWLVVEFDEVNSLSPKLYLVARKQPFLTTYYQYMVHILGERQFEFFSKISKLPVVRKITTSWWKNNLQMQVQVWDGQNWQEQGLISAGYHMPESGADDFLVSLKKLETETNDLKVRFRFMTGAFGIDYVALDDTRDPDLETELIQPEKIEFNGKEVKTISREMVYDDSLVLTYDCRQDENIYFGITGYYSPSVFPEERKKDFITAWTEFVRFFSGGKEYTVKTAAEMGLYKNAGTLDAFTEEELQIQQKPCLFAWAVTAEVFLLIIIFFLSILKCKKKRILKVFIVGNVFALGIILGTKFIWGSAYCQGTINCGNCGETDCQNCSQCSWDLAGPCQGTLSCSGLGETDCTSCSQCLWSAGNCSGTPQSCDQHDNRTDCEACGCTWIVSISLNTDGEIGFGIQELNTIKDTTSGGLNDIEIVSIDDGPVDLDIRSTAFSDGSNTWLLDTSNGSDQVLWEYSKDASTWPDFAAANTLYSFDTNIGVGETRPLYLRLTAPTDTSSYNQHSATVTIVASAP